MDIALTFVSQELRIDLERQKIVLHNARVLAQRDAESHRLQIANTGSPQIKNVNPGEKRLEGNNNDGSGLSNRNTLPRKSYKGSQLPSTPDANYEPQGWTPSLQRRK